MPTSPNSKQVNVSMSGELLEIFNTLMNELNLYTEAELFRIALKFYHKRRNEDISENGELHKKLEELNKRLEILEKQ